jgi:hypothetical protein
MGLEDLNPLSYFKELSIFPRTVFWIGVVFFGIAVTRGVSSDNELLLLSFVLISFALAAHYFSRSTWNEPSPPYKERINWKTACAAVVMICVTVAFAMWLDQVHSRHALLKHLSSAPSLSSTP